MDSTDLDVAISLQDKDKTVVAPLAAEEDEIEDADEDTAFTRCGYLSWRPDRLQVFNRPPFLVACIACYSFILGFLVNGVNNVNLSTLERRFDLSSTYTGFIMSSYDISAATLALLVGFYGSGRRKSRLLALAMFVSAIGSFTMTIPHFATEKFELSTESVNLCHDESQYNETCSAYKGKSSLSNYFYVFLIAQLLHGIGGTTMFTVGISLIDDCVMPNKTPLYLGIVYGCNILGAGLGYVIGGQLLKIYVDFYSTESVSVTNDDSGWVGAWWLGPLIACVFECLPAIPLSMFGPELPHCKEVRQLRVNQAHITSLSHLPGKFGDLKFVSSTFSLFKNPCFMFITLGMVMEGMCMTGLAAFLPKFIENQYGINVSEAAVYTGLAVIPAAVFGLILGGWIADHWKLDIRQSIKLIITMSILSGLASTILWIKCDQAGIYGITLPYSKGSHIISLDDNCNRECNCDTEIFEPLCGNESHNLFFSPCYAGCKIKEGKEYSECSCLENLDSLKFTDSMTLTSENCREPCKLLFVFICLLLITFSLSFVPIAPADSIQLRCVSEDYKTYAQGVKTFIVRMLGSFVGPIVVGKLLDLNCETWREKCGETLSCWIYDQDYLTFSLHLFIIICKVMSITFCSLAFKFYHPPAKLKEEDLNDVNDHLSDQVISQEMVAPPSPMVEKKTIV